MACISDLFDVADLPLDESVPKDPCQLSALFEEALRLLPNDTPTRFTALSVYCALANHPLPDDEILTDPNPPDDFLGPEDHAMVEQLARARHWANDQIMRRNS
jgi:hypothetical protein